ncbi:MAG TPA: hypothetical protein VHU92_30395 [Streptosporangiaceae bacterium]|nr:hypothetical protein [Streptosporangiaceae bacterium]
MPDILSQGRGDEPGPRRWFRLAAAAVLVVAAVLVGLRLSSSGHSPGAHHPAAARSRGPSGPTVVSLPREQNGVAGPVRRWPASLRLPVTGSQPVWYWPATGREQVIRGLPRRRVDYSFTRAPGGWLVQPGSPSGPSCADCAGHLLPAYFLNDRGSAVSIVGLADAVAPAVRPGRLWLTSFPPGASLNSGAGHAQEVSLSGARTGPQVPLPPGYLVVGATSRGLLLGPAPVGRATATDRLWNPADPRADRTFQNVLAVGPNEIAWAPPCVSVCRARLLNLATGHRTVFAMPRGSTASSGTFSPDGRLLALQVSYSTGSAGGSLAIQLVVASVTSGRMTPVQGTWASSDALVGFGWPADGDSLVAELGFTTKVQLTAWRPGVSRLAVVALSPREAATAIVTG